MAVKLCFSLLAKASVLYYSNCLNQIGKETEKTRGFGKIVEEWMVLQEHFFNISRKINPTNFKLYQRNYSLFNSRKYIFPSAYKNRKP